MLWVPLARFILHIPSIRTADTPIIWYNYFINIIVYIIWHTKYIFVKGHFKHPAPDASFIYSLFVQNTSNMIQLVYTYNNIYHMMSSMPFCQRALWAPGPTHALHIFLIPYTTIIKYTLWYCKYHSVYRHLGCPVSDSSLLYFWFDIQILLYTLYDIVYPLYCKNIYAITPHNIWDHSTSLSELFQMFHNVYMIVHDV